MTTRYATETDTRLSRRQRRLLVELEAYIDRHGYAPSMRDLQDSCDISSSSVVAYNLDALERYRYIARDRPISRSIRIKRTEQGPRAHPALPVPLLGDLTDTARLPDPTARRPGVAKWVEVAAGQAAGATQPFALRARSAAALADLVPEGGIIVLERADRCEDNQRAAVWLAGQELLVLGRVRQEGAAIAIFPAGGAAIRVDRTAAHVQARVLSSFVIEPYRSHG